MAVPAAQRDPGEESPHSAYERCLQQKRTELLFQQRWDRLIGYAKLTLGALAVFFMVRFIQKLHGIWPLLCVVAAIVILTIAHEKVLTQIRRSNILVLFYERGIARLEDRWAGTGEAGERFLDPAHPYSRDLDIFGKGSLFELLCTVRTRAGEETLAGWLQAPATPDEICARQASAQELKSRMQFREKLFTAGNRVRLGLHPEALIAWGEREWSFGSRWFSIFAAILAFLWVACGIYGLLRDDFAPFLVSSLINWLVSARFKKHLMDSVFAVEDITADLDLLGEILEVIEQENFRCEKLFHLQSSLVLEGLSPSAAVRKLDRIVHNLLQRKNLAINWFLGFVFYTAQLAMLAEAWRKKHGSRIREWLSIMGEIEALAALACYAFEHPSDSWPEIVEGPGRFDAEAFAHPLLPEKDAIRNDLRLGDTRHLIVLSGPNMSGKSTFVRGIGVNVVLAQCGAPVRAKRLRMSRLAVGASICVLDSLLGGVSRFYAEIKRLKLISDLAQGPVPLLFLLDELLSGTNSHDRLEGTKLIVRSLVQNNAIGLVTTHDLALAQIPEEMPLSAQNYHFEDHLADGILAFDFKLKPGVVRTSNALKLMESIGLPTSAPSDV